jgi:hypothetical protein
MSKKLLDKLIEELEPKCDQNAENKYLLCNGTGISIAQAPRWVTIDYADIPSLPLTIIRK